MTPSGYFWRARVLFFLALAVGAWFGPSALLGFLADEGWQVPDPSGYEVVTRTSESGPIIARRAATWWDVAFHFAIGPLLIVIAFLALSVTGCFYSYRWMLRYQPQRGMAGRFALLAAAILSVLGLWRLGQIARAHQPTLAVWSAWFAAMAAGAATLIVVYRKVRAQLIDEPLRPAA